MKAIEQNENGYIDHAFFSDVKAVKLVGNALGEYRVVVFGTDGSEELFSFKTKSPKTFPLFVTHQGEG